ncbi:hypothetical protein ACHAXS_002696 [Conticribra weissflogii]
MTASSPSSSEDDDVATKPPSKYLSFSAIVILASNTMNGPGLTTLPQVATLAGMVLFVVLIGLSVAMASFVCRRMVFAMWSSLTEATTGEEEGLLDGATGGGGGGVVGGGTSYGGMVSLRISGEGGSSVAEEDGVGDCDGDGVGDGVAGSGSGVSIGGEISTGVVDELIPKASNAADQLIHHISSSGNNNINNNSDNNNNSGNDSVIHDLEQSKSKSKHETTPPSSPTSLLGLKRPLLERTSIVGQAKEAYGRTTGTSVAFAMVASALCLGLAQMMLCAAIMDGMFVALAGKSCALGLPSAGADPSSSPSSSSLSFLHCTEHLSMKPFVHSDAPVSILSVGWFVAAGITVALGTVDLDEMMGAQYALFACLLLSCARFAHVLRRMGQAPPPEGANADVVAGESLSWFVGPGAFHAVGPIMFNFAFVVTAPPLSAMAKKETIARNALAAACLVMGVLYACVGLVGAPAANAVGNGWIPGGDDANLLSLILLGSGSDGEGAEFVDLLCIASFGLSQLAAVPVYCLLAQETLVNDAGIPKSVAFWLSNVLPWILVALTYNAAFFEAFVNWSGLLILGYANFSLPLLLDMRLKVVREFRGLSLKKSHGGGTSITDDGTMKFTGLIFSIVTASISAVIAMSISGSLVLSGMFFVLMFAVTQFWPSASLM